MKRQVVLFDIDGVLADFVKGFTTLASRMFEGVPITETVNQPKWDGFPGMTDKQIAAVWAEIDTGRPFWSELEPMATEYELERIDQLTSFADVYFTTARRGEGALFQTKAWLHDRAIWNPNIILVHKKGEVAKALNATFMIDDKAGNAVYAEYHNKDRWDFQSYVLDRPYNRFDAEVIGSKVKRVSTVERYLNDIWVTL